MKVVMVSNSKPASKTEGPAGPTIKSPADGFREKSPSNNFPSHIANSLITQHQHETVEAHVRSSRLPSDTTCTHLTCVEGGPGGGCLAGAPIARHAAFPPGSAHRRGDDGVYPRAVTSKARWSYSGAGVGLWRDSQTNWRRTAHDYGALRRGH